jgi:hypothetical protein
MGLSHSKAHLTCHADGVANPCGELERVKYEMKYGSAVLFLWIRFIALWTYYVFYTLSASPKLGFIGTEQPLGSDIVNDKRRGQRAIPSAGTQVWPFFVIKSTRPFCKYSP